MIAVTLGCLFILPSARAQVIPLGAAKTSAASAQIFPVRNEARENVPAQGDTFGVLDAKLAEEEAEILRVLQASTQRDSTQENVAQKTREPLQLSENDAPLAADGDSLTDTEKEGTTPAVVSTARVVPTTPENTLTDHKELALMKNKLKETVQEQTKSIASLREAKHTLESRVMTAESKLNRVLRELEETKEELLLAETEVERLSHIIEKRNIESLQHLSGSRVSGVVKTPQKAPTSLRNFSRSTASSQPTRRTPRSIYDQNVAPQRSPSPTRVAPQQHGKQLPIATVVVKKANLRTGPGLNNSVLLTVSKNSRLVVEKRQGGWYRVIAPSGERAWISGKVVHFGPTNGSRPNSTVRIHGITK
jgi:hypothetical protein